MSMTIETDEELASLRAIGRIVARCLKEMASKLEAGMTTAELDQLGEAFLIENGAQSAPRTVYEFPGATCISINEEVAHGIPGDRVIEEGDLVHIDVSALKDGFYGDTGAAYVVGKPSDVQRRVCMTGRRALKAALARAKTGARVRHLGRAMEAEARRSGFGVIKNLGSHGIGRALHEEPKFIPGYDEPKETRVLTKGLVVTLEPFVTTGDAIASQATDGWTLKNLPGSWTAQYEHTLVITDGRPIILTQA
jgi:methionyl aminopeptidase